MDWFLKRLQYTNPTLDYKDILDHADDFKMLLDQKIIKHSYTLESIPCDLCDEDHIVIPFRNDRNEIIISCFGNHRVITPDELKIWTINRDALIENVKSENPLVDKAQFEKTNFVGAKDGEFRITRDGDDFRYKGDLRMISKDNESYLVFCALFDLIHDGEISYEKLGKQIKSKIRKTKHLDSKKMRKFIQSKLTDRSNGFMHYANIPENEDNGKPLLSVKRGKGIVFNNKIK